MRDFVGRIRACWRNKSKGLKKPSTAQMKRILTGVQQIGRELSEVKLLL